MPGGRPPEPVPQDKADAVCQKLREGQSLRSICREPDMPGLSTVFQWLAKDDGFAEQYRTAREVGFEIMAEDLLEIADDTSQDTIEDDKGNVRADNEWIQRSKLRVDTRKWILSKQLPRKYGDRQHVEHSGGVTLEALVTESFRREKSEGG